MQTAGLALDTTPAAGISGGGMFEVDGVPTPLSASTASRAVTASEESIAGFRKVSGIATGVSGIPSVVSSSASGIPSSTLNTGVSTGITTRSAADSSLKPGGHHQ